ncbi:VHS domain-containing protein [Flagelloscypha sp. PMI_526]|nr:VHS domain-containing protein [Flagelloscypha sp. PMI_526]
MLNSPTGNWMRASPIEVLVTRACDPSLPEPNYAVHLEVAEYINQKKANTPREAALLLAKLSNHRNPHISILALALLDTLVQSCGYPFHLQVSTKEFLNELVRRFPERPPPFPGPVMSRILELINTWKEGICVESRWKEDLGNIRDMHRLLIFKGYRFRTEPGASRQRADRQLDQIEQGVANLKSAEELEEEDREAQSAKLQELIRRGTPRDLAAAQELMKSLAGAEPQKKPDYRSQALTELNKLEQKVILLNEMLDNVDPSKGEKMVSGDVYDQVSSLLKMARPKIQKWIEEAQEGSDDSESLDTFLQINDQINTVQARYEAFKKGDYSFASNPVPSQYGGSSQSGGVSLIDFDDPPPAASGNGSSINDLDGLFGMGSAVSSPPPPQQSQPNPQMFSSPSPATTTPFTSYATHQSQPIQPQPQGHAAAGYGMAMLLGETNSFTKPTSRTSTPLGGIALPGTPGNAGSASTASPPNLFGGMGTGMAAQPAAMFGQPQQQPQQQQQFGGFPAMQPQSPPQQPPQQQQQAAKSNDPFGDLAGLF